MAQVYKLFRNPPDNPSYEQLMNWLADTMWVEGRTRKVMSSLDQPYLDDYIQEVWLQILEVPQDKIMSVWRKGKGKFCNYIKSIISNNVISVQSNLYKHIRKDRKNEIYLDDQGWINLDSDGVADSYETELIRVTKSDVVDVQDNLSNKRYSIAYNPIKVHQEEIKRDENYYDLFEEG